MKHQDFIGKLNTMKKVNLTILVLSILCALLAVIVVVLAFVKVYPQKKGITLFGVYKSIAPGYAVVNGNITWLPGLAHKQYPHIFSGLEENSWQPEFGYAFVDNNSRKVKWVPDSFFNCSIGSYKTGKTEGSFLKKTPCNDCRSNGGHASLCSNCSGKMRLYINSKCQNCRNGFEVCRKCSGSGKEKCNIFGTYCHGKCDNCVNGIFWGYQCPVCRGTGKHQMCQGTGIMACTNCAGKGKYTCSICRGHGQTGRWELCHKCSGMGKKISVCNSCGGAGFRWENISSDQLKQLRNFQYAVRERVIADVLARNTERSPKSYTSSAVNNKANANDFTNQQIQQQLFNLQMQMLNDSFSSGGNFTSVPSYTSGNNYGSSISTTRRCSIHGVSYDLRYGGCAMCRQPDFGSGKTANVKCYKHGVYYNPSIGCPMCR